MLVGLTPVTSATFRTLPARYPPTTAPTIPRTIVPITPSLPPMIMLVMNPAIAPRTIHAMMPIATSTDGWPRWWEGDKAERPRSVWPDATAARSYFRLQPHQIGVSHGEPPEPL